MSEGNTCIAEPNLKLLPLRKFSKGLVYFSRKSSVETVLKNKVWSDATSEVSLLHYQMLTNSAVNRDRAFAINNWNNSFYYLWTNFTCKVICNFCMINELLIWFKNHWQLFWFYWGIDLRKNQTMYEKLAVISYLNIFWQIKYFLSKFYFEILKWSFVWIGDLHGNFLVENNSAFFCKIVICWILSPYKTTVG